MPLPLAARRRRPDRHRRRHRRRRAAPAPSRPTPAAPVGDAERGKQLTYTCQGCHGITATRTPTRTTTCRKLGGQSAEYLINALTEYRNGNRKHPTMQAQAQSFSEQDIADIAAYLSSIKSEPRP